MWRRLQRRAFTGRRPAVFPEQYGLLMVTVACLLGSIALVVWVLFG